MSCKPKLEGPCGEWCALDPEQGFNDHCFKICRKYLPCKSCPGYYEQCLVTTLAPSTPATSATASNSPDNSTAFIVVVVLLALVVIVALLLYCCRKKLPCCRANLPDPAAETPLLTVPVKTVDSIHVNVTDGLDEATIKCLLSDEGEVTHCRLVLYEVVEDAEDVEVHDTRQRVNNQNRNVRLPCPFNFRPECLYKVTVTPEKANDVAVPVNGNGVPGNARYNATRQGGRAEREFYTNPNPPTNVVCTSETSTSITVTCRLPDSSVASRKCYVSASPMEGENVDLPPVEATCDEETDPTHATATIGSLEPTCLYAVTVYSVITQIGGDEGELRGKADPVETRTLNNAIAQASGDNHASTPVDNNDFGLSIRPFIGRNDVIPEVMIPESVQNQNLDGGQ